MDIHVTRAVDVINELAGCRAAGDHPDVTDICADTISFAGLERDEFLPGASVTEPVDLHRHRTVVDEGERHLAFAVFAADRMHGAFGATAIRGSARGVGRRER